MASKKLVIFDFDGVLVDTLLMCFNIHKEVNGDFTYEEYQKMSYGNFHDALDKNKNIFHPEFQKIYDDKICDINVPPILKDAVIELSKNHSLVIVSSGDSQAIRKHLEREGIVEYFSEILGFDFHTSKEFKLKKLIGDFNIQSKDAVLITDTLGDVLEANAVDIPSVAVLWGLHDRSTFAEGKPAAVIDDPKQLISAIEKILGK